MFAQNIKFSNLLPTHEPVVFRCEWFYWPYCLSSGVGVPLKACAEPCSSVGQQGSAWLIYRHGERRRAAVGRWPAEDNAVGIVSSSCLMPAADESPAYLKPSGRSTGVTARNREREKDKENRPYAQTFFFFFVGFENIHCIKAFDAE